MHFTDGTIGDVGVVKILNNHVASINTMIADGRITGDNGAYATYDLSTNTTTVIPKSACRPLASPLRWSSLRSAGGCAGDVFDEAAG